MAWLRAVGWRCQCGSAGEKRMSEKGVEFKGVTFMTVLAALESTLPSFAGPTQIQSVKRRP